MSTILHLSQEEIDQLNIDRFMYGYLRVQKRLFAIYLKVTTDFSDTAIAQVIDCDRNSIRVWEQKVSNEGLQSLYIEDGYTPISELEKHREKIEKELDAKPVQTAKEVASIIEGLTGLKRSPTCVRTFLHKSGYKYFKMRPIPAKAVVDVQRRWLEQTLNPYIEKARKGLCTLLFMDASHFVLGAFICFVWSKVAPLLKTSAGRNRINVLGAVNAIDRELTTLINTTFINATVIIEFLNILKLKYVDVPIAIVLDNARYQHCQLVIAEAKRLGIELVFLPSYSPNLNIIERFWKFTRKKVLYSNYFDTPKKFHDAIMEFMRDVNQKFQKELESLLELNFQLFEDKTAA